MSDGLDFGLPKIKITFEAQAERMIRRSERGTVLLFLKEGTITGLYEYTDAYALKRKKAPAWSEANKKYIEMALSGGPRRVLCFAVPSEGDFVPTLDALEHVRFDYAAMPEATEEQTKTLLTWLDERRKDENNPGRPSVAKLVIADGEAKQNANSMYVINFAPQSVTWRGAVYTAAAFTAKVAGDIAAIGMTRSLTALPLEEVTAVTYSDGTSMEARVNAGQLVLIYDGEKWKYGRGVNSFSNIPGGTSKELARIRTVEAMDLMREDIARTFADDFQGQVLNSYNNRQQFCATVTHVYFRELAGTVLDPDFDNRCELDLDAIRTYALKKGAKADEMDEMALKTYNTDATLFAKARIKLLGAIEDLEMTISI